MSAKKKIKQTWLTGSDERAGGIYSGWSGRGPSEKVAFQLVSG